jgi:short-subunit dehydrogenase
MLAQFVRFIGIVAVLRFAWYVFKVLYAYFSKPVNLKARGVKWVLITGASSGVGRELTVKVLKQDVNVIGIGRNNSALSSLEGEYPGRFKKVVADLSDPTVVAKIFDDISDIELGAMFVCHGSRIVRGLDEISGQELVDYNHAMITSNLLLAKHYTQKTGDKGTITFVCSCHSFTWLPYQSTYGSVKRFLNQFAYMYQLEVKTSVQSINPGRISDTPFNSGLDPKYTSFYGRNILGMSASRVADIILGTAYSNLVIDIGLDTIVMRIIFTVVPPPLIDFFLKRTAVGLRKRLE